MKTNDKKTIKFVDLFAGIGGFHKAFQMVAEDNNFKSECVFVSEIDKFAIETYSNNYNIKDFDIKNIREIDKDSSQVPDHDFLFAGFPCQTFSNAGNKKGFLDEIRGTLFFDIANILKNKKPKFILLENVKHLVNHDDGKTWITINETLKNLGYIIPETPLILSPHNFGIPQERQRVFIPGILKDAFNEQIETKEFTLDIKTYLEKFKNDVFDSKENTEEAHKIINSKWFDPEEELVGSKYIIKDDKIMNAISAWGEFLENVETLPGRTLPVIWLDEIRESYEIPSEFADWRKKYLRDMRDLYNHSENKKFIDKWFQKYNVTTWGKREKKFEWQAGSDIRDIKKCFIQLRQSGIRCKRPNKFPTLVAMVQVPIVFDNRINDWRHLTPKETGRLQSFPEDFQNYSNSIEKKDKDFYSYKQFGNSVNVKIVKYLQEFLFNYII